MNTQGLVGGSANAADGVILQTRFGRDGDTIVSKLHADYAETTFRGKMLNGGIVGQVTTVGLATTYTGLCLSNAPGNTVRGIITFVGYSSIVAFAAGSVIGLMVGYNAGTPVTHTTPVTVRSNYVGLGSAGALLLDSACTLPTAPTFNMALDSAITGALTTAPKGLGGCVEIKGCIVLPPGAYCAFYTSTASGAAGMGLSFTWEETAL